MSSYHFGENVSSAWLAGKWRKWCAPTNDISSDESYDAQILDENSREDFHRLNEFTKVIHNDELGLQYSKGESSASTENYELFTHNDSRGKESNLHIFLTLSLQTDEDTWSLSLVHRC